MNKYIKLDECCQIALSSIDKKSKSNEKPIKLCNFTDVYYNWNIYSSMTDEFMEATASDKNIDIFSLKQGDVVITKDSETRDDIGMSAFVYEDLPNTVLGYHCALIRPLHSVDGSYLNAFLNSYLGRKHFENQASGSGQRYTLTKEALGSIKIPLIPIHRQKAIGALFSNIDKRIHNGKQTISELESLAKTIYDYWFLQFEFPNEDGKPYKSSGGKMVWNDELKREIPEGWKVKTIKELLSRIPKTGTVIRDDYSKGTKYPIVDQSKSFICGYTDDENKVLNLDDCIVFGDHTNYSKYINFPFARGADGTQIINSNDSNLSNYLLYLQIISLPIIEQGYSRHYKFLKQQFVQIPLEYVNRTFNEVCSPLLKQFRNNIEENKNLTNLRNTLLPLLMNGQTVINDIND